MYIGPETTAPGGSNDGVFIAIIVILSVIVVALLAALVITLLYHCSR